MSDEVEEYKLYLWSVSKNKEVEMILQVFCHIQHLLKIRKRLLWISLSREYFKYN